MLSHRTIVVSLIAVAGGTASLARLADRVSYFDRQQVSAAFAKGAVLFDGTGTNYMVHASRRDGAGRAEVHTDDTDIIYVLDGAAAFVTGGTVVDPETTATGEIRGKEIRGGDLRRLYHGDVIIVPAGTPHWFKEVTEPMRYFVVKVRRG